ncbi:YfcE family phosphodiesterase [bacterium]|nr:YfcE family phosphodiesterase [bacterium]
MKRLLVVSDTHGRANLPAIARLAEGCDLIVHLGDGFKDGQQLALMQPVPIVQVLGNNDLPLDVVPEKQIELEGWPILLTHGHRHGVKHDLVKLVGHADDMDCRLVLFGHIHRRAYQDAGRVQAFCPSSAAYNYDGTPPSVGLIDFFPDRIAHHWLPIDA